MRLFSLPQENGQSLGRRESRKALERFSDLRSFIEAGRRACSSIAETKASRPKPGGTKPGVQEPEEEKLVRRQQLWSAATVQSRPTLRAFSE
jgi:hypothetical protein